jgi:hypothetical protein
VLFEFISVSSGAPISCELHFRGESYGWEAQFFRRGELLFSRGAFTTRALASSGPSRSAMRRRPIIHHALVGATCTIRPLLERR